MKYVGMLHDSKGELLELDKAHSLGAFDRGVSYRCKR